MQQDEKDKIFDGILTLKEGWENYQPVLVLGDSQLTANMGEFTLYEVMASINDGMMRGYFNLIRIISLHTMTQ